MHPEHSESIIMLPHSEERMLQPLNRERMLHVSLQSEFGMVPFARCTWRA